MHQEWITTYFCYFFHFLFYANFSPLQRDFEELLAVQLSELISNGAIKLKKKNKILPGFFPSKANITFLDRICYGSIES